MMEIKEVTFFLVLIFLLGIFFLTRALLRVNDPAEFRIMELIIGVLLLATFFVQVFGSFGIDYWIA